MNHQVLFDLRCLHDLLPCSIRKTRCPACCHVVGYADHGGLVLCGMENQGQGKSMDSQRGQPCWAGLYYNIPTGTLHCEYRLGKDGGVLSNLPRGGCPTHVGAIPLWIRVDLMSSFGIHLV